MKSKIYFNVTAVLFLIVGLVHFLRLVLDFGINISNLEYPTWLSVFEMAFAFYLSYQGFKLGKKL